MPSTASVRIAEPEYAAQIVDPRTGQLTPYGYALLRGFYDRLGGSQDSIAAVVASIGGFVPESRQVNAGAGLHGGGALSADVALGLYRGSGNLASLPNIGNAPGDWAFATDQTPPGGMMGTGAPVYWSGGQWNATYAPDVEPPVMLAAYTVATLPAPTPDGLMALATDCTQTIAAGLGAAPTGGGSNKVPVVAIGGAWVML